MRAPYGHRLTDQTDGPFRLCECGIGIALDPRDELKVYRRHRLHLEAVEHVSRDRHPAGRKLRRDFEQVVAEKRVKR